MTNLKFGIISNLLIDQGLARVYFPDDDFESAPLKIMVMRSAPDQIIFPFDINEHVACLMDEHCEYGVILGAVYDEGNKPVGAAEGKLTIRFGDSSAIEYDRNSHILKLDIKGEININCTKANITADETNIAGILNVTGAANIQGIVSVGGLAGIEGAAVTGSDTEIQVKSITASDDVSAGDISLKTHKHISAGSGSPTGEAIP